MGSACSLSLLVLSVCECVCVLGWGVQLLHCVLVKLSQAGSYSLIIVASLLSH